MSSSDDDFSLFASLPKRNATRATPAPNDGVVIKLDLSSDDDEDKGGPQGWEVKPKRTGGARKLV